MRNRSRQAGGVIRGGDAEPTGREAGGIIREGQGEGAEDQIVLPDPPRKKKHGAFVDFLIDAGIEMLDPSNWF